MKRYVGVSALALIAAGVPANRIQTGAYGDPQMRTERHVAVLVSN